LLNDIYHYKKYKSQRKKQQFITFQSSNFTTFQQKKRIFAVYLIIYNNLKTR